MLRLASESATKVSDQIFKRKFVALGRILKHWDNIMGSQFSHRAQPVRIYYNKRQKQKTPFVTLHIAVNDSDATILHYQHDLILERINHIFGERWISRIKFVIQSDSKIQKQRKVNSGSKRTLSNKNEPPHPITNEIEDTEMKDALNRIWSHLEQHSEL